MEPAHAIRFSFLAGALLLLAACAMPPSRKELAPAGEDWMEALVARCERQLDERALADTGVTPAQLRFLRRVNALENAIAQRPTVAGNAVRLLVDGPVTHAAQLAAIARARHHIHLNTYILTDDSLGQRYLEALRRRTADGVQVRLLYDAFGGRGAEGSFLKALRDAGVELHAYAPINPAQQPELWRISRRQHRKILIVDGRVAFTGGINISDQYRQSSSGRSAEKHGWRDTNIRIEGPAVADFQRLFFQTWQEQHGPIAASPHYWPAQAPRGAEYVRVVVNHGQDLSQIFLPAIARQLRGGGPRAGERHGIYGSYLVALSQAQSRIWITQAYFSPNEEFTDLLKQAAGRGVDVRLLLAGRSDVGLLLHTSRRHYQSLLESGVRIYEYEASVLHAKTAVIDGVWATVGSSNLDYRSFIHNDEANAIVFGRRFAEQMEQMFVDDLAQARAIEPAQWRDRGLSRRLRERMASLFAYWF